MLELKALDQGRTDQSPLRSAGMLSRLKTPHLNSQKAVQATEAIIGVRTITSRKSITGSVEGVH